MFMDFDHRDRMFNRENAISLPKNTSKIVQNYYDGYFDAKEDKQHQYYVEPWGAKSDFEELIREPLEFFASCKCCDRHQIAKPTSFDVDPTDLIEKHECLLCCNEYFNYQSTKCSNSKCGKTFCCKCIHKLCRHTGGHKVRCPYCRYSNESTKYTEYFYHNKRVFCTDIHSWKRLSHNDCRCGCRKHMREIITEYQLGHKTRDDYDHLTKTIEDCYDNYTEQVKNELTSKVYVYSGGVFRKQLKKFNDFSDDTTIAKGNVVKLFKYANQKNRIDFLKKHIEKLVYDNPWLTLDKFTNNMIFEPLIMFK